MLGSWVGARRAPGGLQGRARSGHSRKGCGRARAGAGGSQGHTGVLSPVEEVLFLRVLSAAWYLSYEESKAKRGDVAWAEDFQSERQEAIEHASDKITSR